MVARDQRSIRRAACAYQYGYSIDQQRLDCCMNLWMMGSGQIARRFYFVDMERLEALFD